MNPIIHSTAAILLCIATLTTVRAESFEALRTQASGRTMRLAPGTQIEGIVVSDYRSMNTELNPNKTHDKVDLGENLRTAYIQSPDGRFGFRLRFDGIYENRLTRGSRVRLNLGGCEIIGETNPVRYTINGLKASSTEVLERDASIPVKERTLGTLTDEDIYTLVTLTKVEFLSKQGAYANIWESCVQRTRFNAFDKPSRRTDGWASLLRDGENRSIYLLINTACTWRRDGRGVPHGIGSVTGVIVHTPMRRYGGDMGRHSIRPRDESDIHIPRDTASAYAPVAEWNWDRNYQAAIRFEAKGDTPWASREGVAGDRVLAEIGKGVLGTTSGARMRLDTEYDPRNSNDGEGRAMRANAALRLDSEARDWYTFDNRGRVNGTQSIVMETSTEGLTGRGVCFVFSFVAGNHDINRSWGFPAVWKVEYSTDGLAFTDIGRQFILRPMVYENRDIREVGPRPLTYDAALGFTEYSIPLPTSLLDCKQVFVRLSPASPSIATIPENPDDNSIGAVVSSDLRQPFVLRLGRIGLHILK